MKNFKTVLKASFSQLCESLGVEGKTDIDKIKFFELNFGYFSEAELLEEISLYYEPDEIMAFKKQYNFSITFLPELYRRSLIKTGRMRKPRRTTWSRALNMQNKIDEFCRANIDENEKAFKNLISRTKKKKTFIGALCRDFDNVIIGHWRHLQNA